MSKNDIANFINKTDFDNKLLNFNKRVNLNKTEYLLIENEFKKLQTFDSSPFIGQSYFTNDGAQIYLLFQPIHKTITTFSGLPDIILECESKGLRYEKTEPPFTVFLQKWYG